MGTRVIFRILLAVWMVLGSSFLSRVAWARELWVIHTNDMHSLFEHAEDPRRGGYARVKGIIDHLKSRARIEGVETLVVDGGDFSEGSEFFFADHGHQSWHVMNLMGYDAVTLGNHDWLAAPTDPEAVKFAFLGANFEPTAEQAYLKPYLKPFHVFEKAGVRLAVLGLTSPEFLYTWKAQGARFTSHTQAAFKYVEDLHEQADFVMALTHLGLTADRELARQVPGIDWIVGSHSHDLLTTPLLVRNRRSGREVPIVQAGKHGEWVGWMKLDLERGKPIQVLDYRLIPVEAARFANDPQGLPPEDSEIIAQIQNARRMLERDYGAGWLYEVIGVSEVPLVRQEGSEPTVWSQLVVDSMLDATSAELAIDVPEFSGLAQPAGPITREMLMILYPRCFSHQRRLGWNVWTAYIRGALLKWVLKQALQAEAPLTFGGLTYDAVRDAKGRLRVSNIRLHGEKIRAFHDYKIAVPEGIGRGGNGIFPLLRLALMFPEDSGVSLWSAVEDRIRRTGPLKASAKP